MDPKELQYKIGPAPITFKSTFTGLPGVKTKFRDRFFLATFGGELKLYSLKFVYFLFLLIFSY